MRMKEEEAVSEKSRGNDLDYAAKPKMARIAHFLLADAAPASQNRSGAVQFDRFRAEKEIPVYAHGKAREQRR